MLRRRWSLLFAAALLTPVVPIVTAAPALADTSTPADVLAMLPTSTPVTAGYDRALFGDGWDDADGNGCDTRSEVLQAESTVPVTFSSDCTVATGEWTSPYDGAVWTDASDVDIDHMVPLAEAWASGARGWDDSQREAYANDLEYPDALIAVTDEVNQSKGDRDPATWLPPLASYTCTYATDWVLIKYRWHLSVDAAERAALAGLLTGSCGDTSVELPAQADTPQPTQTWPLYLVRYSGVIYELVNGTTPVALSYDRWRDVYGLGPFSLAPTDYVKYPWAPSIYAVTFWPGGEGAWDWALLSGGQWAALGHPAPRAAGWIKGSYYYRWPTSAELFVRLDGVIHKLTYNEWVVSGYRPFSTVVNLGFQKLSWYPAIGFMNSISGGQGFVISPARWQSEGFPTPQQVRRFPGDQFYKNYGNPTIYYAGPLLHAALTYPQWAAAGFPVPSVRGTPPPPSVPPNPGDSKNCSDFPTQAAAQAWFNLYYPYYGDVAMLDADHDRIACETLP